LPYSYIDFSHFQVPSLLPQTLIPVPFELLTDAGSPFLAVISRNEINNETNILQAIVDEIQYYFTIIPLTLDCDSIKSLLRSLVSHDAQSEDVLLLSESFNDSFTSSFLR